MHKKLLAGVSGLAVLLTLAACSSTSTSTGTGKEITAADLTSAAKKLQDIGYDQIAAAISEAKSPPKTLKDGNTFTLASRIADKVKSGQPINYVSSYQSSSIAIFSAQYKAGNDNALKVADSLVPMKGKLIGPAPSGGDIPGQIAQIQALLNTGQVDCLSINPPDPAAFTAVINQAISKGIPVFASNIAGEGNEFTDFAQISLEEGKTAGKTVLDWMTKNNKQFTTFAITGGAVTAPWALGRAKGFEQTILAAIPGAKFVNPANQALPVTYDPNQSYDAYKALISGNPGLQFILNVDVTAENADRAVADAGKTGSIYTAGWNPDDAQLDAIGGGTQVAVFDQSFIQQGAFGPIACAMFLGTGKVSPNTQKLVVIDKSNLDEARAALQKASK